MNKKNFIENQHNGKLPLIHFIYIMLYGLKYKILRDHRLISVIGELSSFQFFVFIFIKKKMPNKLPML
jgi:hypothetical protein